MSKISVLTQKGHRCQAKAEMSNLPEPIEVVSVRFQNLVSQTDRSLVAFFNTNGSLGVAVRSSVGRRCAVARTVHYRAGCAR